MRRLLAAVLAAALVLSFAPAALGATFPHQDANTVMVGVGTGVTAANPLTGSFTTLTPGTLTATVSASGPARSGTLTITGPASCSATGTKVSCSIADAPAGEYTLTFTPSTTSNSVSVIVELT
jgi:hypothetical protein